MDEKDAVETKGTAIPMPEEIEWGNQVRFSEPTVKDEQGNEHRTEEEETTEDAPEAEELEEAVGEPEEVAPVTLLPDPGEFKPGDHSFDVVSYDEDGKNPKITKIKSVDQWDELLNTDPNLGSAAALMKAQRLATKMETALEREQKEHETAKKAYDEQQTAVTQQAEALQTMTNEISYLVEKGFLPKVANQYVNADWSDTEIAKQAGVKEQLELLTYMKSENARRTKAGLKPMSSMIDGFNAMQLDQNRKKDTEKKKELGEARKAAGARVSGSTPSALTAAPKGIAVGRVGRLSDLDTF